MAASPISSIDTNSTEYYLIMYRFTPLIEIYEKNGWDIDIFNMIKENIYKAIKCPCITYKRCIHGKYDDYTACDPETCEASKTWFEFSEQVRDLVYKYFHGIKK